jgi:transcriptional regulator with GAF, ATPase, and Fis domain
VPLVLDGINFGAIVFRSFSDAAFDTVPDALLLQVSAQLSGAIAYHRVNDRLSTELREQSVLSRIGQVIGSGSDIDTVMTEVLETISELIVFDSFFVNVLNPDGKTFTDRQVHGTESTQAFDGRIWPLDGSLTRATVSVGRPLKATGLARGEWELGLRSKDEIEAVGRAEVVAIPLVSDGEIFGIVQFRSQSQLGHYDRIGDDFLMSLGAQLAGAMAYDQVTEQLSTELRVQSALAQISQIVGSELDIKTTSTKWLNCFAFSSRSTQCS